MHPSFSALWINARLKLVNVISPSWYRFSILRTIEKVQRSVTDTKSLRTLNDQGIRKNGSLYAPKPRAATSVAVIIGLLPALNSERTQSLSA